MFSYYGSKNSVAKFYPEPKYDTIIEPFAGSAQYSYYHWNKKVIIIERDERIYGVWKYLQSASLEDIMALPDVKKGEEFNYPVPEVCDLVQLVCSRGALGNHKKIYEESWNNKKITFAKNVHKIKHWDIRNTSFENAPVDMEATWFLDPPCQHGGSTAYKHLGIDYYALADWAKALKGQVMVCERFNNPDWLPFLPFVQNRRMRKPLVELLYYQENGMITEFKNHMDRP